MKPHISINTVTIAASEPKVLIINNGAGTAYIKSIDIEYKGEFFSFGSKSSITSLIDAFGIPEHNLHRYLFVPGQLSLSQNSTIEILAFPISKYDVDYKLNKLIIEKLCELKIYINYSCIYEKNYNMISDISS